MASRLNRSALLSLALFLTLVTGCIFSPDKKAPTKTILPDYPRPITPSQALENLINSYVARDSVETKAVYDPAYQGNSTDPSAPTPNYAFSREDEARHVGALKLNNNIVSVFLDLGPPLTWRRLPPNASDPQDWAVIPIPASTIRIDDVGRATLWESVNRVIEYTFKPTVHAPGDTTWTVIRWTESTG